MRLRTFFLILLATACAGCSWSRFQLPKEFKGKKLVEDPPITQAPLVGERRAQS